MNRLKLALLALSASGLLLGCDPCAGSMCGACPAAIMLDVVDGVTGDPVLDVVLTGVDGACDENPLNTTCHIGSSPGQYEITVDASGYETNTISITVGHGDGGCCDCGYVWVDESIEMMPL
ncbi:MAG: hypothetical protein ABI333_17990 [bacterium]